MKPNLVAPKLLHPATKALSHFGENIEKETQAKIEKSIY